MFDSPARITPSTVGADDATVNDTAGAGEGVTLRPDDVVIAAVMVMVLAVVPDCRSTWLLPPVKTAFVEFAGMVKFTVWPPVPNCTAGSGLKLEETASVRVPLNGIEYGDASDRPIAG